MMLKFISDSLLGWDTNLTAKRAKFAKISAAVFCVTGVDKNLNVRTLDCSYSLKVSFSIISANS
jgi:hypothetical protein